MDAKMPYELIQQFNYSSYDEDCPLSSIMNIESTIPDIDKSILYVYKDLVGHDIPNLEDIVSDLSIIYLTKCADIAEADYGNLPEWEDEDMRQDIIGDYITSADYEGAYDVYIDLIIDRLHYLNLTYIKWEDDLIINDAQLPIFQRILERSLEIYGK